MKNISIKYNPYHIQTEILVEGKLPKDNSKLHFGKLRLQEWAEEIPDILVKECNDREFCIHFTGTPTDYNDLKEGFRSKSDIVTVSKWSREEIFLMFLLSKMRLTTYLLRFRKDP